MGLIKNINVLSAGLLFFISMQAIAQPIRGIARTSGKEIVDARGRVIKLKGVNLGNWLVPEGYMFKTGEVGAPSQINQLLLELVGTDSTASFWQRYLDSYITKADIRFLKRIGANHIRLPFHYAMFTNEEYMGRRNAGFEYFDKVISWCREENIYVLLDMHCAPGGQTGYNIDDSAGYPWLFFSEKCQALMTDIWVRIAKRYRREPVVLGYDLVNEPIASYFTNQIPDYNHRLFLLYKHILPAIRKVDPSHAVFLSGSMWAMDFGVFESILDINIVYEFHKYHFDVNQANIQQYLDFRDRLRVPIYIGETGENTDEWTRDFTALLNINGINWAYWPYKKMHDTRGTMNFPEPEDYVLISKYATSDRSSYEKMRKNMPDRQRVQKALNEVLDNARFQNSLPNRGYIEALGFKLE